MSLLSRLRKPTLFGFTIFDSTVALLGTWLAVFLLMKAPAIVVSFIIAAVVFIPLGIAVHYLTGTATPLNCKLGLASSEKCVGVRQM